jgi:16S rRNA (adenine1518-N6/adenine1519-N6)-dimethyltransferase
MRTTGPNSLGQHFLTDWSVVERIVQEADLTKSDHVLEIGSGDGTLTSELCRTAGQVTSLEIDITKFEITKNRLRHCRNLNLVNANPFSPDSPCFEFDVFVSNIPYSRSKDTILWLTKHEFDRALILVQKEFARKLISAPDSRDYRTISVISDYCFSITELFEVPRTSFDPPPSIQSQLIKLVPSGRQLTDDVKRNVAILFSQRRRKISKVASKLGLQIELDSTKRVSQLSPLEIVNMATNMSA